jgi:LacI family transcriptional regulator
MATIRDVARMAGVSKSTVSLALNDAGRVSPETRQKVWSAAQAVGYAANPVAQSLKSGRSRLIGMVVSDISNPFFGALLREVERCAVANNFLVIVSDSRGVPANEREILNHLSGQRVAGILLCPCGNDEETVAHIGRLKMPLILFDHKVAGLECDFIGTDNVLATSMLTEHLIRLGHTRIAHIAGTAGLWTTEERKRGFLNCMAAAGLDPDPRLVLDGQYDGEKAYAAAMRLLTQPDRPTAIIAANNVTALGVLEAINDLGYRCPEDISLTCIDDVPWGKLIKPRLTMVVQPVLEMARVASERLLSRIAGRSSEQAPPEDIIFTPRFVLGESCASYG